MQNMQGEKKNSKVGKESQKDQLKIVKSLLEEYFTNLALNLYEIGNLDDSDIKGILSQQEEIVKQYVSDIISSFVFNSKKPVTQRYPAYRHWSVILNLLYNYFFKSNSYGIISHTDFWNRAKWRPSGHRSQQLACTCPQSNLLNLRQIMALLFSLIRSWIRSLFPCCRTLWAQTYFWVVDYSRIFWTWRLDYHPHSIHKTLRFPHSAVS